MFYLFRHLLFLSIFACFGLVVLGFAFEKLHGNTTSMALFGFTACVVHAAAFWFVMGPVSPLKRGLFCLALLCAGVAAVGLGRWFYIFLAEESPDVWWSNLQFSIKTIPAWWLLLVVQNIVIKQVFRWRLYAKQQSLEEPLTVLELFELTTIIGVVFGISGSTFAGLYTTEYFWVAVASTFANLVFCLPLAYLIMRRKKRNLGTTLFLAVGGIACVGLLYLASFRFLTRDLHSFADLAIGLISFLCPFALVIFFAREKYLTLHSTWSNLPVE